MSSSDVPNEIRSGRCWMCASGCSLRVAVGPTVLEIVSHHDLAPRDSQIPRQKEPTYGSRSMPSLFGVFGQLGRESRKHGRVRELLGLGLVDDPSEKKA